MSEEPQEAIPTSEREVIEFLEALYEHEIPRCPSIKIHNWGYYVEEGHVRWLGLTRVEGELPDELRRLHWLKWLTLTFCKRMTGLQILGDLPDLELLSLAYSKIRSLPDNLRHLHRLRMLSIAHTQIDVWPAVIHRLPALQFFSFDIHQEGLFWSKISRLKLLGVRARMITHTERKSFEAPQLTNDPRERLEILLPEVVNDALVYFATRVGPAIGAVLEAEPALVQQAKGWLSTLSAEERWRPGPIALEFLLGMGREGANAATPGVDLLCTHFLDETREAASRGLIGWPAQAVWPLLDSDPILLNNVWQWLGSLPPTERDAREVRELRQWLTTVASSPSAAGEDVLL